jgi:hypothetical protein
MTQTVLQSLSSIAQLAAVIGIFLLYRQIQLSRSATQCQLINELEKEFSSYNVYFVKLKLGAEWHEPSELSAEDIAQLENLAAFCEKLKHFLDLHVLDWRMLDLMFRYRFFLITRNLNVRKYVIDPCRDDWKALLKLENEWIKRLPKSDHRSQALPVGQIKSEAERQHLKVAGGRAKK